MTDITTVLLKALAENGPTLGVPIPAAEAKAIPCFFLERELAFTKQGANTVGYSHVKLYKGHYLDYVNKREYNSLEEWTADYRSSIDNILFGYNKFDGRHSYMTLKQVMQYLCPSPADPAVEELSEFAARLSVNELSLQKNVLVITKTAGIQSYNQFMAE
jgi:hypothetical protein